MKKLKTFLVSKTGRTIFSRVARNIESDTFDSSQGDFDLKKILPDAALDVAEKILAILGAVCAFSENVTI